MKTMNKMETEDKQIRHFLMKSDITSPFGVFLNCIQIVNELCLILLICTAKLKTIFILVE